MLNARSDVRPRFAIDMGLIIAVAALLVIGVAMVFSASFVVAETEFGDDTYFLVRHVLWVGVGLVVLATMSRIDYHIWQRMAVPIYVVTVGLLAVVLIPGVSVATYGASRWLSLGPILSFQPSEMVKLAVVLYLGAWITRVGGDIQKLTFGTIPFALILAISAGLVLVEPDLGTAIVLVLTAASVFFVAGANVLHALLGAIIGCVLLVNFVINSGYKADRIRAFVDPWADPGGIGWHTTQALIALGSGGWAGLGLGASRQKYFFVPNAHTDTIFAIVGEEIGFIGTSLVLGLFLIFAWRGLTIASGARDPLGRALATGATLLISWQALLNMAVVSHLVPNTGVPLPFVSYGGSSTVVSLAAVGILLNVSRTVDPQRRSWRAWLGASLDSRAGPADSEYEPPPNRTERRAKSAASERAKSERGRSAAPTPKRLAPTHR